MKIKFPSVTMAARKRKTVSGKTAAPSLKEKPNLELPVETDSGIELDLTKETASESNSVVKTDVLPVPGHLSSLENGSTTVASVGSEDPTDLDGSAMASKFDDGKTRKQPKKGTASATTKRSLHNKISATPMSDSELDKKTRNELKEPVSSGTQRDKSAKTSKGAKTAGSTPKEAVSIPKKRKAPADGLSHTKRQKLNGYGIKHGQSPFPDFASPTPEQCKEVVDILSKYHHSISPKAVPPPSLKIAGCGQVPAVHDAMLRTRISAATKTDNANNAIENLVKVYGIAETGVGKGSINWNAIRLGSREKLLEALKCGGLAGVKSKDIKEILDMIAEQNKLRCEKMVAEGMELTEEVYNSFSVLSRFSWLTIFQDKDPISLQHIKERNTEEAYVALIQYPGIGVKTAACVILFCLQRPCYAVDTHVWRLTKDLGWVPPKANEIKTFAHCQVRVPDEYKYKLHQLFWHHGQKCVRCRAGTSEKSEDWDKGCPIEHLVTRLRKERKVVAVKAKGKSKGKTRLKLEMDDDDELEDFPEDDMTETDDDLESDSLDFDSAEESKPFKSKASRSTPSKPIKAVKPTKLTAESKALKLTKIKKSTKSAIPTTATVKTALPTRYGLRSKSLRA